MKLAISSHDGKIDTQFSPHFGRCETFVFVDTETKDWESQPNPATAAQSGAATQVVQFLSNSGVEATIAGRYGPNAFSALNTAGIQAYIANSGTPEELLVKFLANELAQVNAVTGPESHR
jgi:predicted Fe-Mo cluster-binding NifX family protein